jgi:hypothetical protein
MGIPSVPDVLGAIEVRDISPSGVFPIGPDCQYGRLSHPHVAVDRFGPGTKMERPFLLGIGA